MLSRNIVNQFHHVDGFTNTSTTEEPDFTALCKRTNQVNDFNTGLKQLVRRCKFFIGGGRAVNRRPLLLTDGSALINRVAQYIHDATKGFYPNRNRNGGTGIVYRETSADTFRWAHSNGANNTVTELLLNFQCQAFIGDSQGVIHLGNAVAGKLYVNDRANNLYNLSTTHFRVLCVVLRRSAMAPT